MATPRTGRVVPLELDELDLGQALDALDSRSHAYERTAAYLDGEDPEAALPGGSTWEKAALPGGATKSSGGWDSDDDDGFLVIEEVSDAEEARGIAAHFRAIEASLRGQWDAWRARRGQ